MTYLHLFASMDKFIQMYRGDFFFPEVQIQSRYPQQLWRKMEKMVLNSGWLQDTCYLYTGYVQKQA